MLLAACADKQQYVINCSSELLTDGHMAYLFQREGDEQLVKLKTAVVADNSLLLKGRVENPVDAVLLVCDSTSFNEATFEFAKNEPRPVVANLILEPGNIVVSLSKEGDGVRALSSGAQFNDLYNKFHADADSVRAAGAANDPDKFFGFVVPFIKENVANIVGRLVFDHCHWSMPKEVKLELLDSLEKYYGGRFDELRKETIEHLELQRKREEQALSVQVGKEYKNLEERSVDGKSVSLKSVVENSKNRYVLLEFWLTDCAPCIMEMPNLLALYEKYKAKGFEVYSMSLDDAENAQKWVALVNEKRLPWVNLRAKDAAKVRNEYGIYGVPATFLIECATDNIVGVGLRGEALSRKLAELLDE